MKKLLCFLCLVLLILSFASCGETSYELSNIETYSDVDQVFISVDPFSLEAGEQRAAVFTEYKNGELQEKSPCLVSVSYGKEYENETRYSIAFPGGGEYVYSFKSEKWNHYPG